MITTIMSTIMSNMITYDNKTDTNDNHKITNEGHGSVNHTSVMDADPVAFLFNSMAFSLILLAVMCTCNRGVLCTVRGIQRYLGLDYTVRPAVSRSSARNTETCNPETLQTYIIAHQEDMENPQSNMDNSQGMPDNAPDTMKLDEPCSICFENFSPRVMTIVLDCKHRFHTHCIIEWLQKEQTCPLCRRELKLN